MGLYENFSEMKNNSWRRANYSAFTETGANQTLKTNQMAEPKQ